MSSRYRHSKVGTIAHIGRGGTMSCTELLLLLDSVERVLDKGKGGGGVALVS